MNVKGEPMPDSDKFIRIDEHLHYQTKLAAALEGISIKEYTERAIRAALSNNGKLLVDSPSPSYSTEATS